MSISLGAQQFRITGVVRDLHDNTVLSNAHISLNGVEVATTNQRGEFQLEYPSGDYQLKVTHFDCQPFVKKVALNQPLQISIFLEHHTQEIETVVFHALHKNKGTAIIKTLNQEAIAQNTTENLGNILSEISGVSSLKTGNRIAKPVINGLYGSRILMMNNGVKMAEQEWGIEHAPSIDANAYEHIDVLKGTAVLKYGGDAMGGVVLLEPAHYPKKDTLIGKIALSGVSNGKGLALNADIAKVWHTGWAVHTQGSAKKLGDLQTPHYSLQNTGMDENAFQFSIQKKEYAYGIAASYSHMNQNFGIYKGAHISNARNFADAINHGLAFYTGDFGYKIENPQQEVSHQIAKVEGYHRFGQWGKLNAEYAYQHNHRYEYDVRRGAYNAKPATDLLLTTQSLRLDHLLQRKNWDLQTGLVGAFQVNFPDPKTERSRLIPDYHKYDAGAYAIFKYQLKSWQWEAGARYDYNFYDAYKYYLNQDWKPFQQQYTQMVIVRNGVKTLVRPQLGFHNMSASLGLAYQASDGLKTKLNIMRNSRSPNAAELFADGLHHAAAIIEKGDLSLQQEVAYQVQLSLDFNLKAWQIRLNPYALWSGSFINQTPAGVESTIRGNFPVWKYQQIKAKMLGIDAEVQWNIAPKWQWLASASYVYGQDETHREPLILMPPLQVKNTLKYQSKTKNPWSIQAEHLIIFKQHRFPIRTLPYEVYENNTVHTEWLDISTPPAGYHTLNVVAGVAWTKNLQLNLRVNNFFNTAYRDYLNRLRFFSDALGRNVILTLNYHF
ncbi:TonB-dependent receptor [Riemerella columbina]|uniref:TonB-dependent receptor n=1 Tax=Riemerella columbina TaxID=103810 RepID=UPI0026708350|nr:TonB-dependent receptor [Riemerella columbina]WKS94716.1 TonB-dependent receptor [Riemerella columbina]